MPHDYAKTVRFGEVDQAQVVYFPRLLHFCHLAMEDFFERAGGLPYAELVRGRRLGFPTVHLEADFRAPMAFGDRLTIRMSIVRLGRSSVTTRYRFLDENAQQRAEVQVTTACTELEGFAAVALPPDLRELFEAHLEGPSAD